MTYSIIAREPQTGAIGIAVASRFFACGALVPWVGARTAVATQSLLNPLWGVEGRARLNTGETAQAVLDDLVARDTNRDQRQLHLLDSAGQFAAHTGPGCIGWAGHVTRADHSVAGNMLAGPEVVEATSRAYADGAALPFPQRLLAAMRAGEDAGGDRRGRQAAGLVIHHGEDYPWLDLRVDDHGDPLAELDRLLSVAGERYLHVTRIMPTADNFSGPTGRDDIDQAILAGEEDRRRRGIPSRSLATAARTA